MDAERIIKKYPNRRLYDTGVKKYVTLEDIRGLVRAHVKFRVIDAKSDDDITRNILLQIVLEEEDKGAPIFSAEVLEQIIRTYGDAMQAFMSSYLKESLGVFLHQQRLVQEQMAGLIKQGPIGVFNDLAQQNLKLWQELQQNLFDIDRKEADAGKEDRS
jgi:polyhydroxyalkanoate synthesis repressor PhaR